MAITRLCKAIWLLSLAILFIVPTITDARQYTANPADYRLQLKKLQVGDQLVLSPGLYLQGLPIHHLEGRMDAPIVITGPEDGSRAVLIARSGHNTISIVDSRHVTIRYLELDGRGLPVDGVKCEGHAAWAHHITLEHLLIRDHNFNQQIVGISTKCPAWNWIIRHNVIQSAGTGLYLGNSDGNAPFIAGLIEHNLVNQTLGYNLQIKHQRERPAINGMPRQDQVTIIRHNVFAKASQNEHPAMARPNVLVGHWPLSGQGQNDRYLIYGNFFYENSHEALFQGEGNIALYNNLFVNHHGNGINIQPHHSTSREIHIFFNTILANGVGIHRARTNHPKSSQPVITANLIFAQRPLVTAGNTGGTHHNLAHDYAYASTFLVAPFAPLGQLNLAPIPGKPTGKALESSGPQSVFRDFLHWQHDFDGNISENHVGAYAYGKPARWLPQLTTKPNR